jgi:hypothetical protein
MRTPFVQVMSKLCGTAKTTINFSILRNTCLRVFASNPINDHAPLPGFSLLGSDLLTQQGDSKSSRLVAFF